MYTPNDLSLSVQQCHKLSDVLKTKIKHMDDNSTLYFPREFRQGFLKAICGGRFAPVQSSSVISSSTNMTELPTPAVSVTD